MEFTHQAPNVPLSEMRRTKIIATVGPSTNSYEAILNLIKAGANGLRLNFSHGTHEEREQQIIWIRKASHAYNKPVAIIADMQGPKIRLGDFEGVIPVQTGQTLRLQYKADYERSGIIPTQYDLSKKVSRGERLYIFDGKVRSIITSVREGVVHIRVENDGILLRRKGLNLPDTDFGGDVITKKDKEDLAFASTHDIDYVAMSFIQTPHDLQQMRRILKNLGSDAKIIAKIETQAAIQNIEGIVQATDAIMVARGDLAIETLPEAVPIAQRRLIALGIQYAKPTIVATQMLASMTETPEPTRAEVSDVATAVLVGADCVMLSDETASGKYPIEAVQVMKRVIRYTQDNAPVKPLFPQVATVSQQSAISHTIISLASQLQARAIVAETKSGATAILIAANRPEIPIVAVTSSIRVAQQLTLLYGTIAYVRPDDVSAANKLTDWLRTRKVFQKGDVIVTVSGKYPGVIGATDTIKVRALE